MAADPVTAEPGDAPLDSPERKWTVFTRSMVAVLAASILVVTAALSLLAITRIREQATEDGERRAADLARFVARTAFVPVSLEDQPLLKQAVSLYLDDPDLVYLTIEDARGDALFEQRRQAPPGHLVDVAYPIAPPVESGAPASASVGTVRLGLSLQRSLATARRAVEEIALGSLVLLVLSLAFGLTLISGMTQRLRELVGEARLSRELRRSNEQLEAFSYSVAHDLRAPLRHIDGFIDLLAKSLPSGLDEEQKRYLDIIANSAKRMGALIDDLLSFSRTSRAEMHTARCSLDEPLRQALEEFQTDVDQRGVSLKFQPLPEVECDPAMLRLVFQNLLGNALKFTRKTQHAEIQVGSYKDGAGKTVVFVRDNGVGFDMAHAKNLFGVFQRLHSRSDFEGTGIGLANVRRIIERHGGETWAESKPGEGATFFFSLPRAKGAAA